MKLRGHGLMMGIDKFWGVRNQNEQLAARNVNNNKGAILNTTKSCLDIWEYFSSDINRSCDPQKIHPAESGRFYGAAVSSLSEDRPNNSGVYRESFVYHPFPMRAMSVSRHCPNCPACSQVRMDFNLVHAVDGINGCQIVHKRLRYISGAQKYAALNRKALIQSIRCSGCDEGFRVISHEKLPKVLA
jgi:hypothetical protein